MTSDPLLEKTQRIWKSGQSCIGGDRLPRPPLVAAPMPARRA